MKKHRGKRREKRAKRLIYMAAGLTLVIGLIAAPAFAADPDDSDMSAQTFQGTANDVNMSISAPESELSEDTEMSVTAEEDEVVAGENPVGANGAYEVSQDGYIIDIYDNGNSADIYIRSYTGSKTGLYLPEEVTVPETGITYCPGENARFIISADAFRNNTRVMLASIPTNYVGIEPRAFRGCTNLKLYYFAGVMFDRQHYDLYDAGIGTDAYGRNIPGVTFVTYSNSPVEKALWEMNQIRTAAPITIRLEGGSLESIAPPAFAAGVPGYAVDASASSWVEETDPPGTVFRKLQAKATGKKSSIRLSWKKVRGAKKYVIYGNLCDNSEPLNKLVEKTTKNTCTFKKVLGNKVKKGTYYKFMVVAFDKNDEVLYSSKIIFASLKTGGFCNCEKVKTKAKKNRVKLKVNKTFKLKAKAKAQSKKLKIRTYRDISYESSDPTIATVSGKGVIKAEKKGICYVYAYSQNGVCTKIKVTVK